MKKLLTGVAVAAVAAGALAGPASASTTAKTTGKLTSFTWNAKKKTGKLHVLSANGTKTTITLNATSGCGVSRGQSGDEVDCATFGQYQGRNVFVTARKYSDGHRLATIISADLTS